MSDFLAPKHRGLWYPMLSNRNGERCYGTYRPVRRLAVLEKANPDRQAVHAVIAFPEEGYCYIVEDARQLKVIIDRLQATYGHLVGRGQSKIVSLSGEPALDGAA